MANRYDQLLLAKMEVTKGTDSVPVVATDAIRIESAELGLTVDGIERNVVKATMGQLPHLPGKKDLTLAITLELRGSGAAGTAPDLGVLLRACALAETVSASVSVAYDPSSDIANEETISMYWYEDGLLWKFLGTVGDASLPYEMNGKTMMTFTMQAAYTAPTTTAKPSSEVYQTTPPVVASSADVFSEGGVINVGSYELAFGNTINENFKTGIHEFSVADRAPTLTLNKNSVSTIADWTALVAGTDVALSSVIDGGAGNKVTISAPIARRKTITGELEDHRHLRSVEYGLYEDSAGDDQFQMLFE